MKFPLPEFLGRIPVRVRRGLARGAWWSLYPHSSYWRLGGNDPHVEAILLRHAARPGASCWDLGAHHGIYSAGLARAIGPAGRVEAFEPDPVSFRRLCWHRRLNRLENLRPHNVAASARTGPARLYQYDDFGGTTSHLPHPGESLAGAAHHEIAAVALDEWVDSGRLRAPDFVKIDVEGHAGPDLEGMRRTLSARLPVVLLAIHHEAEERASRAVLDPLGYRLSPAAPELADRLAKDHFGEFLCLPPSA